ncbi:MAG: M48 family metalloprotease [Flavobacteriales bacterium]|nr:M48 family metalloprotease [Flavobacteriales bacterium]
MYLYYSMQDTALTKSDVISPLKYHVQVRDFIKENEPKVWAFFLDKQNKEKELEKFKLALLKNTYRLDEDVNVEVYTALNEAKQGLSFEYPVIVYQIEGDQDMNAGIVFFHGEAHIVLSGSIISKLDPAELIVLFAHEISHAILWNMEDGQYETTERIITAIANDYSNSASYHETARVFNLCTEIFADKGALKVCGDKNLVISTLLKISTGLDRVSPAKYIEQAKEIVAKDKQGSEGHTHPENYIRALAAEWTKEEPEQAEEKILELIQGLLNVEHLDIFQQEYMQEQTKKTLQVLLGPKWFRTDPTEQLAKDYFKNFKFQEKAKFTKDELAILLKVGKSTKEYLSYLLMDFCMVDPELSVIPFAQASMIAKTLELDEIFEKIVMKELKLSKKAFKETKRVWEVEFEKLGE